jgi:choline dehydrogenase-like flavoprotein
MARNVRNCQNSGLCMYGCPVNAKQSMLLTYVPRAEKAGATILAGAQAMQVLVKDGRAAGVEGILRDPIAKKAIGTFRIKAPRVVLSAGAIETPGLLLRSGLKGQYETAGKYYQMHTHTFAHGIMAEPVYMQFGAPQSIAIMEFADVFGFTGPGYVIEGLGAHPSSFAVLATGVGRDHQRQMEAFQNIAMADAICRDRSRGHVELTSDGRPVAVYHHTEGDKVLIRDSMKHTAELLLAAGAKEVFVPGTHGEPITTQAKLDKAMADIHPNPGMYSLLTTHMFSSARMAGTPELGYCDSRGQAWDTKGLYVADGSSLPSNLGANPQITIMSVARKIATHVVEDAQE